MDTGQQVQGHPPQLQSKSEANLGYEALSQKENHVNMKTWSLGWLCSTTLVSPVLERHRKEDPTSKVRESGALL